MTPIEDSSADEQLAKELVERARSECVQLVGPGGLLSGLTKTVLETALEVEMEDHLGYAKHAPAGRDKRNSRKWQSCEDGADGGGRGRDQRATRPGRVVRAADCQEASAAARLTRFCG